MHNFSALNTIYRYGSVIGTISKFPWQNFLFKNNYTKFFVHSSKCRLTISRPSLLFISCLISQFFHKSTSKHKIVPKSVVKSCLNAQFQCPWTYRFYSIANHLPFCHISQQLLFYSVSNWIQLWFNTGVWSPVLNTAHGMCYMVLSYYITVIMSAGTRHT